MIHPSELDPRPSLWLLGPILLAFAIFSWTHQDIGFATLWGLVLSLAYCHRFVIDAPSRRNWLGTVSLGAAASLFCLVYDATVLNSDTELTTMQRLSRRPEIVSIGSMMLIITTVWLSHLPGRSSRKTGPLICCSGLIVVLSSHTLSPSTATLNLLAVFGGTILLTLLSLGGSLRSAPESPLKAHIWHSVIVLGCIAAISLGTLTISSGLRHLEPWIRQVLSDLSQGNRYRDVLGAGNHIRINRQRRITLSRRVLATITGTTNPGYLRTQVMTNYHDSQWTSDPSPPQPLIGDWRPQGHRRYLTPAATENTYLHHTRQTTSPAVKHQVQLLVNLRGAVPLPYTTDRVSTSATLSCMLAPGDLVQCTPSEQLVAYAIEHRPNSPSIAYGIGTALRPLPQIATSTQFLDSIHRARVAPASVLKPLRQLAHQLVGPAPHHPLEAAQTLQQYFKRHYAYSLEVNLAQHGDPVVDFVLNRRSAYCEYFASGMVLLLRSLGIPARMVGGFVVWEQHPVTNQWIVRQRDAHAWAEVYDETSGRWVAFDATPPARHELFSQDGLGRAIDRGIIWIEGLLHSVITWAGQADMRVWLNQLGARVLSLIMQPIMLMTVGLFALCTALILRWYQGQLHLLGGFPGWGHKQSEQSNRHDPIISQVQYQFRRVATALAQRGIPIGPSETLQEYTDRIASDHSDPATITLLSVLIDFAELYKVLRFQPHFEPNLSAPAHGPGDLEGQLSILEQLADEIVQMTSGIPDIAAEVNLRPV